LTFKAFEVQIRDEMTKTPKETTDFEEVWINWLVLKGRIAHFHTDLLSRYFGKAIC